LAHYESLHPLTNTDIEGTTKLVDKYLIWTYTFGKKDLQVLLKTDELDVTENQSKSALDRKDESKLLREQGKQWMTGRKEI
jgi:uncharacterized protein YehS (DUF1456 family)